MMTMTMMYWLVFFAGNEDVVGRQGQFCRERWYRLQSTISAAVATKNNNQEQR